MDNEKRILCKIVRSENRTWSIRSTFLSSVPLIQRNWKKTSVNCEPHYFTYWKWTLFELPPVCQCSPTGIAQSVRIMQKRILSSYPTGEFSIAFLSTVKPSNIVSTVNMKKEINLPEVVDKLRNTEYNPKVWFGILNWLLSALTRWSCVFESPNVRLSFLNLGRSFWQEQRVQKIPRPPEDEWLIFYLLLYVFACDA